MKNLRKFLAIFAVSGFTSAFALGLGSYQVTPEVGVSLSKQNTNETRFNYGAYGRAWLGASRFIFGPNVIYDVMLPKASNAHSYKNLQIGAVLGFDFPVLPVVPYIGVNFSKFIGVLLNNTISVNLGAKIDVPVIPFLTIGLEGTFQRARKLTSHEKRDTLSVAIGKQANFLDIYRIGATVGLAF